MLFAKGMWLTEQPCQYCSRESDVTNLSKCKNGFGWISTSSCIMFSSLFQVPIRTTMVFTPNTKPMLLRSSHVLVWTVMFLEEEIHQNARKVTFRVKVGHTCYDDTWCVWEGYWHTCDQWSWPVRLSSDCRVHETQSGVCMRELQADRIIRSTSLWFCSLFISQNMYTARSKCNI